MSFEERIGVDAGNKLPIEEAIEWAAARKVQYLDIRIDTAPNALESFDDARCAPIRAACARHGVHLGLHTSSAVNIAETSPFVRDGADAYLRGYIDAAVRLGAEWIDVHAGYHFTSDKEERMAAGLARLQRATAYAEEKGALLLLENLNWEPDLAEVHYLAHDVAETRYYFDAIKSPAFMWTFTANHAHIVADGVDGFIDNMDMSRCYEVRLADCMGTHEEHLVPGKGNLDFVHLFRRLADVGFTGHFMNAFGSLEDRHASRAYLAARAREAGVA